ncbi:polyamine aminopropyltransferase [Nanoarchaeota archaeon]
MSFKEEFEKNNYFVESSDKRKIIGLKFTKLLLEKKSDFQNINVYDSEAYGKILMLDKVIQTTDKDEFLYHESIVHPAMFACKNPKKVLVLGGGDGGCLREVLKHDVEKVVMVELDKEVIEVSKEFLPTLSDGAFDDSRVELVIGDGKKYIEETEEKFDVVILDLTDPFGPSKFLYTKEFYESVKNILTEDGKVSLHCLTPFEYHETFGLIVRTLQSVFPFVQNHYVYISSYSIDTWFCLASANSISLKNEKEISGLKYFSKDFFKSPMFIPKFVEELKSNGGIATVDNPIEWHSHTDR